MLLIRPGCGIHVVWFGTGGSGVTDARFGYPAWARHTTSQLDVTIVNVALPAIQRETGGSLAGLQWVVDAYTLALASVMLTAGSTADRVGARKIFTLGLAAFAIGSAAWGCGTSRCWPPGCSCCRAACSPGPARWPAAG